MPLFLCFELLLGIIGVVILNKLFRPSQESAWESSRVRSNKQAWSQFLAGVGFGCWLCFWAAMVVRTGKYSPYKNAGFYIARDTDQVVFWLAPGTSALLGFDFVAHSIRRFLKYRSRAAVLKGTVYLQ
jgi:hypothetical protein